MPPGVVRWIRQFFKEVVISTYIYTCISRRFKNPILEKMVVSEPPLPEVVATEQWLGRKLRACLGATRPLRG